MPHEEFTHGPVCDKNRRGARRWSLEVLCDEQPGWRPDHFESNMCGCQVSLRFPSVKLLDYRGREAELEHSPNPFATVVLAQLKVLETRGSPQTRWQWKLRLVKRLYERGLKREQVRQLFLVLDWMLTLPRELEESVRSEIYHFEEERRMPHVVTIESMAREKGHEEGLQKGLQQGLVQGLQKGILAVLESKFKTAGAKYARKVRAVREVERLQAILDAVGRAETLDEVRALLR